MTYIITNSVLTVFLMILDNTRKQRLEEPKNYWSLKSKYLSN